MPKYETVIHIISEGCDRYEAGERAGDIIDGSRLAADMALFCEPTRIYRYDTRLSMMDRAEELLASI
ncbi:MAG: hypothetical protein JXB40_06250 [Candidatus Omnitrophica bacterium]|nr:hypothetical protein [Candidatus Omnitrophota bacterium]